jgi:hypothetical protein
VKPDIFSVVTALLPYAARRSVLAAATRFITAGSAAAER